MNAIHKIRDQIEELTADLDAVEKIVREASMSALPAAMLLLEEGQEIVITVRRNFNAVRFSIAFRAWNGRTFTEDALTLAQCVRDLKGEPKEEVKVDVDELVKTLTGESAAIRAIQTINDGLPIVDAPISRNS